MSSFGSPSRSRTLFLPGVFQRPPEAQAILFEAWVRSTYLPLKTAFGGRGETLATTLADTVLFCRFFREREQREATLADLCDELADDFFVWHMGQKGCNSQATANRSRRSLCSVWREAARKGLCYPPVDLRQAKIDRPIPLAWSMDELGRLLTTARDGDWQWYKPRGKARVEGWQPPAIDGGLWLWTQIATLYYTGLRITALLTTPTVRLDLAAAGLLVPADVQKHRTDQFFPLPDDVVEAWRLLDVHGRRMLRLGDDWPYDRSPGGNWKTLNNWLKRLLRSAKLVAEDEQNLRRELWHKLRRTFATHLAAAKGIEAARRWLGHSSVAVTMRYIDTRFLPGINPVEALPRPTMPIPESVPFRVMDAG